MGQASPVCSQNHGTGDLVFQYSSPRDDPVEHSNEVATRKPLTPDFSDEDIQ